MDVSPNVICQQYPLTLFPKCKLYTNSAVRESNSISGTQQVKNIINVSHQCISVTQILHSSFSMLLINKPQLALTIGLVRSSSQPQMISSQFQQATRLICCIKEMLPTRKVKLSRYKQAHHFTMRPVPQMSPPFKICSN